ncbi:MAG: hypothetical protein Q9187_000327 [Circinaria calcarea]
MPNPESVAAMICTDLVPDIRPLLRLLKCVGKSEPLRSEQLLALHNEATVHNHDFIMRILVQGPPIDPSRRLDVPGRTIHANSIGTFKILLDHGFNDYAESDIDIFRLLRQPLIAVIMYDRLEMLELLLHSKTPIEVQLAAVSRGRVISESCDSNIWVAQALALSCGNDTLSLFSALSAKSHWKDDASLELRTVLLFHAVAGPTRSSLGRDYKPHHVWWNPWINSILFWIEELRKNRQIFPAEVETNSPEPTPRCYLVQEFLETKADPSLAVYGGKTALYQAVLHHAGVKILELLCKRSIEYSTSSPAHVPPPARTAGYPVFARSRCSD